MEKRTKILGVAIIVIVVIMIMILLIPGARHLLPGGLRYFLLKNFTSYSK